MVFHIAKIFITYLHILANVSKIAFSCSVEKTRSVPYNPKSDGIIQRFNHTLAIMLSMFVDENKTDRDEQLPYVMAAYRANQHKNTGVTPNLLMLNRELNFPLY